MYAIKKVKFKHAKPEVWFRVNIIYYTLSGFRLQVVIFSLAGRVGQLAEIYFCFPFLAQNLVAL